MVPLKPEYLHNVVTVGCPCKAEYLHSIVVVRGSFESRAAYLHMAVALGDPFEGRVLNYDVVRKILYERIINFSPKMRNIYAQNTLMGPPDKEGLPDKDILMFRWNCVFRTQVMHDLH